MHNNGITNATYVSKAGSRAQYGDGEKLEIPEEYHLASWETINKVVRDVSAAAIGKVGARFIVIGCKRILTQRWRNP